MNYTEDNHGGNQKDEILESQDLTNSETSEDQTTSEIDIEKIESDLGSEDLDLLKDNAMASFNEVYRLMRDVNKDLDMPESDFEDYAKSKFLLMHANGDIKSIKINTQFALEEIERLKARVMNDAQINGPESTPINENEEPKAEKYLTLKNFANRTGLAYEWVEKVVKTNPEDYQAKGSEPKYPWQEGLQNIKLPLGIEAKLREIYGEYELSALFSPERGSEDAYNQEDLIKLFSHVERGWIRELVNDLRYRRTGNVQGEKEKKKLLWSGSEMELLVAKEKAKLEVSNGVDVFSPNQLRSFLEDDSRYLEYQSRYGADWRELMQFAPKVKKDMVCGLTGEVTRRVVQAEDMDAMWEAWLENRKAKIDRKAVDFNPAEDLGLDSPEEIANKWRDPQPQDFESGYDPEDEKYN